MYMNIYVQFWIQDVTVTKEVVLVRDILYDEDNVTTHNYLSMRIHWHLFDRFANTITYTIPEPLDETLQSIL